MKRDTTGSHTPAEERRPMISMICIVVVMVVRVEPLADWRTLIRP